MINKHGRNNNYAKQKQSHYKKFINNHSLKKKGIRRKINKLFDKLPRKNKILKYLSSGIFVKLNRNAKFPKQ